MWKEFEISVKDTDKESLGVEYKYSSKALVDLTKVVCCYALEPLDDGSHITMLLLGGEEFIAVREKYSVIKQTILELKQPVTIY